MGRLEWGGGGGGGGSLVVSMEGNRTSEHKGLMKESQGLRLYNELHYFLGPHGN